MARTDCTWSFGRLLASLMLLELPMLLEPLVLPVSDPVVEPVDEPVVEPVPVEPAEPIELPLEEPIEPWLLSRRPRTSTRCPTYFRKSSDLPVSW